VNKITQAKNHVNQSMTMEQLLEAEQRAAEWIRKSKKIPPSSIENPPEHRPTREKDASTAFHENAGPRQVDFDLPFLKSPFPS